MSENKIVDKPTVDSDLWCTNDIRTSKTTFTWKIKGFKDHYSTYNDEGIKSGDIFIRGTEDGDKFSRWMLEIKPGTIVSRSGDTGAQIQIVLHSKNRGILKPKLCLQVIASNKRDDHGKVQMKHTFDGESSCVLRSEHSWSTIIHNWIQSKFLRNGDLEFVLDFTFARSSFSLGSEISSMKVKGPSQEHKPTTNYEEFYLSKEMSDIQIKCGDKTFDAHQLILSAWSPVFRGMFQAEMKEKESGMVEIQDLDSTVMLEMLKFIYTGRCRISDEDPEPKVVVDLLEAADKYQVIVLKKMCEEVMIKILRPNMSLQILAYADMYGAEELKKQALDLVIGNMKTLRGSDEWKDCAKNRPHLYVDILEALADRM